MKILVVGSGGREHALVWKIAQSQKVTKIFCAPGNPGIGRLSECVPIRAGDVAGLLAFARKERIDLTVVGPEQPLAEGIVDAFVLEGLEVFGPTKRAAELEWSKAFAKAFMDRHHIPTARHRTFTRAQLHEAHAFVRGTPLPLVLKADGLAAGKGVVVCQTRDEALSTLDTMLHGDAFGKAGETVVLEEFLVGQEASVFAVTDGRDFVTLAPAQDHKRAFDGDRGKNTGGMGAYAPAPVVTEEVLERVNERIIVPTLKGMADEGRPYAGCLYVGLMITSEGPSVVEFNCRFGDPETQVVLPLFAGDVVELLQASSRGTIGSLRRAAGTMSGAGSSVCVVVASGGYPDEYATGIPIDGLEEAAAGDDVVVFHAGTGWDGERIVTTGGRVLGVTAALRHGSLRDAIGRAYEAVEKISFSGMHFRRDIGKRGLPDQGEIA